MTKKRLNIDDFYQYELPSNAVLSPNGQHVLYEKTKIRENENDYDTQLWLADIDGQTKRMLTTAGSKNIGAIWSPNGKSIAYLSNQSLGTQLWIHSLDSGESNRLTRFKQQISSLAFAPDGQTIYALLPVNGNIEEIDDDFIEAPLSKRVYESLYYKFDGVGFNDGSRKQLIAINMDTEEYQQLTDGTFNIEAFTVSPSGRDIAFVAIDVEHDNPLYNGTLHKLTLSNGEVTKLYDQTIVSKPVYSPDGKEIAFIAGGLHQRLYVIPEAGGDATCLSRAYPDSLSDSIYTDVRYLRSAWKPQWSNDGQSIYVLSGHQGSNEIVRFSVDPNESPVTVVGGPRAIFDFSYDGKTSIVTIYSSPTTPGRLSKMELAEDEFVTRADRQLAENFSNNSSFFPQQETCLDDGNADYLSHVNVVEPETFTYDSVDGWKMHGFLLKPANMVAGKKYPVVLDIHGGPHSTHGFAYFHQMQLLCSEGYAVVYVNPRGSSGYGEAFTEAVINDYGGKDKFDILNGLDEALKRYHFLDETRITVSGLSYGGFMTNWLITQTDRFKAAISEGGVCNWVSIYGTGDVDPGMTNEDMPDKTSFEVLWEISPLAYVDKVNTPILIIHAEHDHRVPIEQGEQFYSFIKRQGKDARFVRFPTSSHLMLQVADPDKRYARLEEMVTWLKRYM